METTEIFLVILIQSLPPQSISLPLSYNRCNIKAIKSSLFIYKFFVKTQVRSHFSAVLHHKASEYIYPQLPLYFHILRNMDKGKTHLFFFFTELKTIFYAGCILTSHSLHGKK